MNRPSRILRRLIAPLALALLALGLMTPPASAANTAVIAGTVRASQTGDPLPGATVSVYLTSNVGTPVQTATSAVDGTYQVSGLAAGSYKVRFSANAATFVDSWYWFADTPADATAITLAEGDQANWIDGYLDDATTSVAGTVYEPDGATGVQGTIVDLFSTGDTAHSVYSTPTDADGSYLIEGVAPGEYLVRFTPDTLQRKVFWYYSADSASDAWPVIIEEGIHQTEINGYLSDATSSIAGMARSASSAPMGGVTVDLFTSANTTTAIRSTTSAADGTYTFDGLTEGTYKVRFSRTNYRTQWYYFSDTPAAAWDIEVASGDHRTSVDAYLQDGTMSIGGVTRNAASQPMGGVTVDLFTSANTTTAIRSTTSAADGTYTLDDLTAGTYKIRFTKTDFKAQWYYYTDTPATATEVTVAPGQHPTADSYLGDATMSVAGVVRNSGSIPVPGATVDLFSTSNTATPLASATSGADGSYLIPITAADNYLLRFTGPAPLFPNPQWYYFQASVGAATEIVIAPGSHPTGRDAYLTATATWTTIGAAAITGTAAVGSVLTASSSGWNPAPTSIGYQWYIGDSPVAGATAATWTVTPAAAQKQVHVAVVGTRTGYPTLSAEASVSIDQGALDPAIPTISGTARVGASLSVSTGTWSPTPDSFTYDWQVNGSSAGSYGATFVVPRTAVGQSVKVAVTGHRSGYTDSTRSSAATPAVTSGNLTAPAPTISGTAAVGRLLSADPGAWAPNDTMLTYQWRAAGTDIPDASGSTLLIPASALNKAITVAVTGTLSGYTSTTTTSAATAAVALGTLTAVTPTITGTAAVGATLTADPGAWRPYPVLMSYQWSIDGVAFPGATKQTFVVPASASGKNITVTATGNVTGYAAVSRTSTATSTVTGGTLAGPTPTITGTAQVGATLTANPGTWGPAPVTLGYQWLANGTAISGANSGTLVVPASAVGQPITVRVTASKTGFTSVTKTSLPTAAVVAGQLTTDIPTISGSAQVGQTLTANPGFWSPTPDSFTYQWKAAGTNISGATAGTLVIPASAEGKTVTVVVTGSKTGYITAGRESAATATVVAATGTLTTAVPVISGTAAVGEVLSVNAGIWGPAPVALTYQWKSGGTNISGETSTTLLVPASSLGQQITVTVTGTKAGYTTASQNSAATAAVTPGTLSAPTPTISGTAQVGSTLTANAGTWGPAPVTLNYQWKANGSTISGATGSTFLLTTAQTGATITVVVTGTKTGYTTAIKESAATSAVTPAATGSISGLVLETDSTPASGIDICLFHQEGDISTRQFQDVGEPASDGSYRFVSVPAGRYVLFFITSGSLLCNSGQLPTAPYWPQWYRWGNAAVDASPIMLTLATPSVSLQTVYMTANNGGTDAELYAYAKPTITGTAAVGQTLTATAGSWFPAPTTVHRQWNANGAPISGATGNTYTVTSAEQGTQLTVTETASGTGLHTTSATSDPTATVPGTTITGPVPTISGTAKVGSTLTVNAGRWSPSGVTLSYAWKTGSTTLGTGSALAIPASVVGKTITVTVTGSKTGLTPASKTSAPTAVVAPGTLTGPTPTISGTAKVGSTLTGHVGTWSPSPVTLKYQWKANGTAISGATASTYMINASYVGKKITLTVTGSKTGYTTLARTSAATATVAPGTLTAPTPTITGTAKAGSTLTAKPGSWRPVPVTLKYQWKANGATIPGATHSTYKISGSYAGKKITITVTGSKTGYTTVVKTSVATKTVAAGTLVPQTPSISGRAKVGSTLTANPGSWAPTPVTLKYQWKANGATISGATGKTWKVTNSAKGKRITVTVTGSKTGYTTASRTSSKTTTVA